MPYQVASLNCFHAFLDVNFKHFVLHLSCRIRKRIRTFWPDPDPAKKVRIRIRNTFYHNLYKTGVADPNDVWSDRDYCKKVNVFNKPVIHFRYFYVFLQQEDDWQVFRCLCHVNLGHWTVLMHFCMQIWSIWYYYYVCPARSRSGRLDRIGEKGLDPTGSGSATL